MGEASLYASGQDPFLEVKAISRVLSSEATCGLDCLEESLKNEVTASLSLRSISISRTNEIKEHVKKRSVLHSESKRHLIGESVGTRPRSTICVCQGTIPGLPRTPQKIPKQSPRKPRAKGVDFNCSCGRNGEPCQQGELSGVEWKTDGFHSKKDGVFKCIAGTAADCTAVCCCPLSLLNLLTLACIRLPFTIVIRILKKMKTKLRRKQKCQDAYEDDIDSRTPFTPCLLCPESTSDISWTPSSGFADHQMWQEYFGVEDSSLADH